MLTQEKRQSLVDQIEASLEAIQPLRDELKRRSMIYHCELKENMARAWSLPLDYFYDIPAVKLWRVLAVYTRKQRAAFAACDAAGEAGRYCDCPTYIRLMNYGATAPTRLRQPKLWSKR